MDGQTFSIVEVDEEGIRSSGDPGRTATPPHLFHRSES